MQLERNEYLWKKAQKRAAFKIHVTMYLLVNAGLWILYLFMKMQPWGENLHPWPIWPAIGWGIGLATHYFAAYGSMMDQRKMIEKEYERLVNNS